MSRREYENGPDGENGPGGASGPADVSGSEREHRRERRNDRTGNEIVNHDPGTAGAAEAAGADGAAEAAETTRAAETFETAETAEVAETAEIAETAELGSLSSLFGSGIGSGLGPDSGPGVGDGADLDEVALRRMLHGAVRNIEPSDGTLDHLQRAVPVRRAKRRQAVVGLAAAALLIGTAVPAFVHVANSDGSDTANPAIAGHGEQAQGGNGADVDSESDGEAGSGNTDGQADGGPGRPSSTSSPSDSRGQGTDGHLSGGGADPSGSAIAAMPACNPEQLGVASAETGAAGADGTVYGTFRIANVSGTECSVSSGGSVGFQAIGAADPARIAVVQHTAGDAAAGLPDPSQEQGTVLLKPSMAYEVKFAWVPKDTCPTVGGSPSPTPTDDAGGASGAAAAGAGTGSADGTSETETQFGSEDGGGTQDGSVAVMHTPEPGAPVAETKIANACSGTIYRTGVLAPAT